MTREIAAEAAVWIARLHGPSRSKHLERECLAWQAQSAAHSLAFERCTDLWMDAAGVDRVAIARAAASFRPVSAEEGRGASSGSMFLAMFLRWRMPVWAFALTAAMAVGVAGVLVLQPWRDIDVYDTGLGEQRLVVLQDGSRVSLNTSTRLRVELDATRRSVSVEGGEALFEVAKDAGRPFVVQAAGAEVVATGTAFVVRVPPVGAGALETLDVTLVEGQVVVQGSLSKAAPALVQPIVMAAGDRLRFRGDRVAEGGVPPVTAAQLDRPRMDQVLAWKRGEAVFENVSLRDALHEMNRYSAVQLVAAAGLNELRVSGQYKTGDNAGFARAIAALHGLAVREQAGRIELAPKWARSPRR